MKPVKQATHRNPPAIILLSPLRFLTPLSPLPVRLSVPVGSDRCRHVGFDPLGTGDCAIRLGPDPRRVRLDPLYIGVYLIPLSYHFLRFEHHLILPPEQYLPGAPRLDRLLLRPQSLLLRHQFPRFCPIFIVSARSRSVSATTPDRTASLHAVSADDSRICKPSDRSAAVARELFLTGRSKCRTLSRRSSTSSAISS